MPSKFWDDLADAADDPALGPALRQAFAEVCGQQRDAEYAQALSADLRGAEPEVAAEVWHRLEDLELADSEAFQRGLADYRAGRVQDA